MAVQAILERAVQQPSSVNFGSMANQRCVSPLRRQTVSGMTSVISSQTTQSLATESLQVQRRCPSPLRRQVLSGSTSLLSSYPSGQSLTAKPPKVQQRCPSPLRRQAFSGTTALLGYQPSNHLLATGQSVKDLGECVSTTSGSVRFGENCRVESTLPPGPRRQPSLMSLSMVSSAIGDTSRAAAMTSSIAMPQQVPPSLTKVGASAGAFQFRRELQSVSQPMPVPTDIPLSAVSKSAGEALPVVSTMGVQTPRCEDRPQSPIRLQRDQSPIRQYGSTELQRDQSPIRWQFGSTAQPSSSAAIVRESSPLRSNLPMSQGLSSSTTQDCVMSASMKVQEVGRMLSVRGPGEKLIAGAAQMSARKMTIDPDVSECVVSQNFDRGTSQARGRSKSPISRIGGVTTVPSLHQGRVPSPIRPGNCSYAQRGGSPSRQRDISPERQFPRPLQLTNPLAMSAMFAAPVASAAPSGRPLSPSRPQTDSRLPGLFGQPGLQVRGLSELLPGIAGGFEFSAGARTPGQGSLSLPPQKPPWAPPFLGELLQTPRVGPALSANHSPRAANKPGDAFATSEAGFEHNAPYGKSLPPAPGAGSDRHLLSITTSDNNYDTIAFSSGDNLEELVGKWILSKGLNAAFQRGLVSQMHHMVSMKLINASVDLIDLL